MTHDKVTIRIITMESAPKDVVLKIGCRKGIYIKASCKRIVTTMPPHSLRLENIFVANIEL